MSTQGDAERNEGRATVMHFLQPNNLQLLAPTAAHWRASQAWGLALSLTGRRPASAPLTQKLGEHLRGRGLARHEVLQQSLLALQGFDLHAGQQLCSDATPPAAQPSQRAAIK